MSAKLVRYIPDTSAQKDIVVTLEEILEQARKGEYRAVALACIRRGTGYTTAYTNHDSLKLLGAIRMLESRLRSDIEEAE